MQGVTPELLALISRVYDGGLSPDQWTGILDEVSDHHGAMSSALFYHDTRHAEFLPSLTEYSSFWHQDAIREYLAGVHDEEPSARLLRALGHDCRGCDRMRASRFFEASRR